MIIRCINRQICLNALRRYRGNTGKWPTFQFEHQRHPRRYYTTADIFQTRGALDISRQYDELNRIQYPKNDETHSTAAWTALLDRYLPPFLRQHHQNHHETNVHAKDIAEILLAAQRLSSPMRGIDVLFHLGIVEGRWSAVVWVVKRLVEAFGGRYVSSERETPTLSSWSSQASLDEITQGGIYFHRVVSPTQNPVWSSPNKSTLKDLTEDVSSSLSRNELFRRDVLGQIWRSLGHMSIACSESEIKPEILEIIAYLHHMELMPMSIYNQSPSADGTAIQQPPTLNLFSSRILTSLSDAAWRAHAKSVVEEFKTKGGEYASLRHEIPGMGYRVSVAGLRPEIWLELILWSCLHGGWIVEGGEILRTICLQPASRRWRPLSWRSLVTDDGTGDENWDKFELLFKTRAASTLDQPDSQPTVSVQRTISSEVVNAYIDATLSTVRLGVGERGTSPGYVLKQLKILQKFLDRSDLSLNAGSWDGIIMRFFELQQYIVNHRVYFDQLIGLSPTMGDELNIDDVRDIPAYVLDGNTAVLGLFHRALRSRIQAGDVEGAFKLFASLQQRADSNKHKSIVDFLQTQRRLEHANTSSQNELFTSNISGIEFPAFDMQISATTLGPFMELITDAKAYDFGKWLLYSSDLDGPVIPPRLYSDPAVAPALIRFAAETGDTELLSKMVRAYTARAKPDEPTLPRNVLQSFFDSQVNLKRWDAAARILQHMKDTHYTYWNPVNLAQVIRIILLQDRKADTGHSKSHFERAKALFSEMVTGKYDRAGERHEDQQERISILVLILAMLDTYWAKHCLSLRHLSGHYAFTLTPKAFNLVLEGVAEAYGSITSRRILEVFCPYTFRPANRPGHRRSEDATGEPKMSGYKPFARNEAARQRNDARVADQPNFVRLSLDSEQELIIYGALQPDLMTIRIIFRRALDELSDTDINNRSASRSSPKVPLPFKLSDGTSCTGDELDENQLDLTVSGTVAWAIRCLRLLHMADEDILSELRRALAEHQVHEIRTIVPELFEQADSPLHSPTSADSE